MGKQYVTLRVSTGRERNLRSLLVCDTSMPGKWNSFKFGCPVGGGRGRGYGTRMSAKSNN